MPSGNYQQFITLKYSTPKELQTIHYIEINSALRELPTMYVIEKHSALGELQIIPYIQMHSALRGFVKLRK